VASTEQKQKSKIMPEKWLANVTAAMLLILLSVAAIKPLVNYRERRSAIDYLASVQQNITQQISDELFTSGMLRSPCWVPHFRIEQGGARLEISGMTAKHLTTLLTAASVEDENLHMKNIQHLNNGTQLRVCYENQEELLAVVKSYKITDKSKAGRITFVNLENGRSTLGGSYPVGTVVSSFNKAVYYQDKQKLVREGIDGAKTVVADGVSLFDASEIRNQERTLKISTTLKDDLSGVEQQFAFRWQPWDHSSAMTSAEAATFYR
jgi:hypothetical protein